MGKKNSKLKQETVDQLISQTYCKKHLLLQKQFNEDVVYDCQALGHKV